MEGIFLLFVALILAALTGVFSRVPNGKIITGEIVSIERGRFQNGGSTTYYAWVEYEVDGKVYSKRSSSRSSSVYVGDKMKIMYNSENPEEAVFKPSMYVYLWLAALILGAIWFLVQWIIK